MSIGFSTFLIAVGAIMRFAVHVTTTGFSIRSAGTILMIVGGAGLLISLLWAAQLARGDSVAVRTPRRDIS